MKCPHCKKGKLEFVPAYEPWHDNQYQCNKCDSTYPDFEIERLKKARKIEIFPKLFKYFKDFNPRRED